MRNVREIFVHCSDSPYGSAHVIDGWHRARGWDGIGYHYVIGNGRPGPSAYDAEFDGFVECGRDPSRIGAHVRGRNAESLGVCVVGRSDFTLRQKAALLGLLADLCLHYRVPVENVRGHYEVDAGKTCPNISMPELRVELADHLRVVGNGFG